MLGFLNICCRCQADPPRSKCASRAQNSLPNGTILIKFEESRPGLMLSTIQTRTRPGWRHAGRGPKPMLPFVPDQEGERDRWLVAVLEEFADFAAEAHDSRPTEIAFPPRISPYRSIHYQLANRDI